MLAANAKSATTPKKAEKSKSNGAAKPAKKPFDSDVPPPKAAKGGKAERDEDDDDEDDASERPPAPKKKGAKGKEVDDLITLGKSKGFLTYAEVNEALPGDDADPEQMDDVLNVLDNEDIEIVDDAANLKIAPAKRMADDDVPRAAKRRRTRVKAPPRALNRRAPRRTKASTDGATTRFVCTSARWAASRSSPARVKWRSRSASKKAKTRSSPPS